MFEKGRGGPCGQTTANEAEGTGDKGRALWTKERTSAFAPSEMGWFSQDHFIQQWVSMSSRTLVPFHTAELHFPGFSAVRCDHMTKFCPMGSELA